MPEMGLPDLGVGECAMVQLALLEGERQTKPIALIKAHTQHLAILKLYLAEGSLVQLREAEVATCKLAIDKLELRQISVSEVAMGEGTRFIFSRIQGIGFKIKAIVFPVLLIGRFFTYFLHEAYVENQQCSVDPLLCPSPERR